MIYLVELYKKLELVQIVFSPKTIMWISKEKVSVRKGYSGKIIQLL